MTHKGRLIFICAMIDTRQNIEINDDAIIGKGFKHIKRENHQKFKPINDILYFWFKKCEASGIYVNAHLLKKEAMNINNL